MSRKLTRLLVIIGASMILVGVGLPAPRIIQAVLPAKGIAYADKILNGLICLKVALILNGLLAIVFRPLKRWLWDTGTTIDRAPRTFFRHADPGPIHGVEWLIFTGVVLLALVLRLINVNQSLFGDEIAVQQMFISRGLTVILTYFPYTPHHVLYSLIAWFFEKLPFPIEVSYRLPSVLFGTGAVALTYLLARCIFNGLIATITALLSAVAFYGIAYSQFAKGYSATHCLTLLAIMGIAEMATNWQANRGWWLFGIALGTLGYIHLYNVYLCIGLTACCAVVILWSRAGLAGLRRLLLVLGVVGCALFLLYALQLSQILDQVARAASQPEEHLSIRLFPAWLAQLTFWGKAWPVTLVCLGLAVIGGVTLAKREPMFVFVGLGTPVILLVMVAWRDSWIYPRYLVFSLPVFLILCVEGARFIGKIPGVILFALVFLWPTTALLNHYYKVGHQNIRGVAQLASGKPAVSYGGARDLFGFYNKNVKPIKTFTELQSLNGDVYLMYGWRKSWHGLENEFQYIDQHFTVIHRFDGMAMEMMEPDGEVVLLHAKTTN